MIRVSQNGLITRVTQKDMAGISVSKICVPFGGGGIDWSSYWTTLSSATVENAAPTHVVLTFPAAQTSLVAADITFRVNGISRTVASASWTGAVWTVVLGSAVIMGDTVVATFGKTGDTSAVTNNVEGEAETMALIARMTTEPTDARKGLINRTIINLKAKGLFAKIKTLYYIAAHEQASGFLNWISTSFDLSVGAAGGTFTTDRGWAGDATGAYLKTGFKPATHGGAGFQNSASMGFVTPTSEDGKYPMGSYSGSSYFFISGYNGGQGIAVGMNTTTLSLNAAIANSIGYSIGVRDGGNVRNYRNNTEDTDAIASAAPNDYEILIGARNGVGTPNGFSAAQVQFAFIGDALTAQEVADLIQISEDYLWAVGAGVIDSNVIKTVKADGTGDYLTLPAAIAAINDAAITKTYRVDVYNDVTITTEAQYALTAGATKVYCVPKNYISVNGVGARKIFDCSIPDSAVTYDYYAFDWRTIGRFHNIDIIAENIGYCIHMDGFPDNYTLKMRYCDMYHNGRDGLIAYRTANGGTVPPVFASPIGMGLSENTNIHFYDVKLSGGTTTKGTFYIHDSTEPIVNASYLLFEKVEVISDTIDIYVEPVSSGVLNEFEFIDCVLPKKLTYHAYIKTDQPTNDGLNHYDLISIQLTDGGGNTFNDWENTSTGGGSLRITSATAGAVAITGGTAQASIMPSPDDMANHSTGRLEVGEWATASQITLGYRLGDCSGGGSKTLTGTIDGGAFTVTFNENFTARTNAYVLAFITTALAGAGTASLYQRAQEYNPLSL